jgi:hypothetical protein
MKMRGNSQGIHQDLQRSFLMPVFSYQNELKAVKPFET